MKRNWSLVLLMLSAALYGYGQQPVQTTHLSVPTGVPVQPQQQPQQTQQPGTQQSGSTNFEQVQQQAMSSTFNRAPASFDFSNLQLPPIEVLMESAHDNPRVEYFNRRKLESDLTIKSVKREWLRYINLNTNYQYGLMGLSTNVNDPTVPSVYTGSAQSWWSVGATISIPLEQFFDRANRIKRQEIISTQMEAEADTWYEEQKFKVAEQYANAQMYLALIRIKAETSTVANQDYIMSQADFINGRIDLEGLNIQKGMQNVAVTEYEQTRANLYQSILKLEILTNYKILK